MPVYPYVCECGRATDEYRSMAERDNAPHCCGKPMARELVAPQVMPDIQPYKTVAADKESGKQMHIQSRKQHKEFLKRNNYEPTA